MTASCASGSLNFSQSLLLWLHHL